MDKDLLWPEDIIKVEDNSEVILVEKSSQKLYLVKKESEKSFQKILELKCSTGKKQGDKNIEGDAKTPEGVYYITGHYPDKYLSPIYGSRAFTLDYPNFMDKREGKNGHNIWIHGTDKEPLEERTTNGCVALANKDIDKLNGKVKIGSTPVIIVKDLNLIDKSELDNKVGLKLESFFKDWLKSIEKGSYHEYLENYSSEYLPEIKWWVDWLKIREKFKNSFKIKPIKINIFREDKGIYTIWADILLEKDDNQIKLGLRKLFLRADNGKFFIIGDLKADNYRDIVSASAEITNGLNLDTKIAGFVNKWIKAWSKKDMKTYSSCYASDFYSDGMNKKVWVNYKTLLTRKYSYINITKKDLSIKKDGNNVVASFFQNYESSGFSAKGVKTLILKQEEGKWKILKEIWKEAG